MKIKPVLAGIDAMALISLTVAGCGGSSGGGGGPQSMASWYNTVGLPEIHTVNHDIETVGSDQNYGTNPMSDEDQVIADAQAGLTNLPPIDAKDWTGWLNDVILCFQAEEEGGYPSLEVLGAVKQYSQRFAAAVASATGSGSPSAPAAPAQITDPNGDTCSSLDANGYCYADDPDNTATPAPAVTQAPAAPAPLLTDPAGTTCQTFDSSGYCPGDDPSTQAAAPAPVASTPIPRVLPVFACGIGPTAGGSVGPTSGYGSGYTSAVVKVTVLNSQGNAIQTLTLTLTSTETEANGGTPWSEVIDPNGEPRAASCTVTVESASLLVMAASLVNSAAEIELALALGVSPVRAGCPY